MPSLHPDRVRSRVPAASSLVLLIVLATQLMIILDVSIVITALPRIHDTLGFSETGLSWVQNAYTLTFGGLLLLGARAGDLLGRRRMFVGGVAVFTLASMAGGLAQSPGWLLAGRGLQGLGAAIAAPSALSLLTTTFREGPERTRAIAAYATVSAAGGSVGLVVGGLLTQIASWRWGFFLNVPIGALLIWLAPRHLPVTARQNGRFDLAGAATSTLGMTALVYGFVRAGQAGWGDRVTVAALAAGVLLVVAFVATELRAEQPITPLRLFASRERSSAYLARVLVVGGMFSMFFFLTQFLQAVRGYSPLDAGLAFLPQMVVMSSMVRVMPRLLPRLGTTRVMVGGLLIAATGMAWLSRLDEATAYLPGVVGPTVLLGLGMGLAFTPLTMAGIAGVAPQDAGAASGLVNAAHQLGGSLGTGVLVAVFAAAQRHADQHPLAGVAAAVQARHALAHGIATAVTGSALLLVLAVGVVAAGALRRAREEVPVGVAVGVD